MPCHVSDESIMRFGRSHRQNRFPVITWRHPRTRALLLRASAFHSKSVMTKLKATQGKNERPMRPLENGADVTPNSSCLFHIRSEIGG